MHKNRRDPKDPVIVGFKVIYLLNVKINIGPLSNLQNKYDLKLCIYDHTLWPEIIKYNKSIHLFFGHTLLIDISIDILLISG